MVGISFLFFFNFHKKNSPKTENMRSIYFLKISHLCKILHKKIGLPTIGLVLVTYLLQARLPS